tara:strand:+ start:236 stop:529 length:294 start_codon:yes stop_codon:yes gene_type:complete
MSIALELVIRFVLNRFRGFGSLRPLYAWSLIGMTEQESLSEMVSYLTGIVGWERPRRVPTLLNLNDGRSSISITTRLTDSLSLPEDSTTGSGPVRLY